jgi:hypothetical protein
MNAHAQTDTNILPDGFLKRLEDIVGPAGLITDPADMETYLEEQRGLFRGVTPCVVRPSSPRAATPGCAAARSQRAKSLSACHA